MNGFLLVIALVLLATMAASLIRGVHGPAAADRMMAAQLLGTTGVGILLVLAQVLTLPALVDVALVFALLAAVATAAFTRRPPDEEGD
ncbi:monovalent cation/H+ antiporter complex subunit F [Thiococcus pfennigii]|jgi:multicomponent Na+:H+ antiporter subunit F|uniref:monovalent cation/H+ antiporter complex subunit F n=1 Tax=Thiococcus pfennigii TaxID=1057 RepID=UPI001907DEBF|nr:monovalent cation/H+ antiporter complex subunit F [Thiococcus pfennigii]MBK1700059.1 multiple resistance and pH regulation protein F [Thiococcus pfennigii]MBK1732206.1 multiple resistance and pH regulation protein F [Thiococcus pfennigii]